jgi:hypothetical protein
MKGSLWLLGGIVSVFFRLGAAANRARFVAF